MSDASDEEEGRWGGNPVVTGNSSDEDSPVFKQSTFRYKIHSNKLINDSSANNFVQDNRYDTNFTVNGNMAKLWDNISISNAIAVKESPSYMDAKNKRSRDDPNPYTRRYHHALNSFQTYIEETLPLKSLAARLDVPYGDVLDFFYYAPRTVDFRTLGGPASAHFHEISDAEFQTLDIPSQAYWNETGKFLLHLFGTEQDSCIFNTESLEAEPTNELAIYALKTIWSNTMSG
mmetsp:Transcript_3613/g.10658  ORF Transcript_3613/g.10658 Transcript_3613/m.10658 type:complete len:232 (+) Transcript_3613:281-976(+)